MWDIMLRSIIGNIPPLILTPQTNLQKWKVKLISPIGGVPHHQDPLHQARVLRQDGILHQAHIVQAMVDQR